MKHPLLNKYRNSYYNSSVDEEVSLAKEIDVTFEELRLKGQLISKYKELVTLSRFQHFNNMDTYLERKKREFNLNKEIRELEIRLGLE